MIKGEAPATLTRRLNTLEYTGNHQTRQCTRNDYQVTRKMTNAGLRSFFYLNYQGMKCATYAMKEPVVSPQQQWPRSWSAITANRQGFLFPTFPLYRFCYIESCTENLKLPMRRRANLSLQVYIDYPTRCTVFQCRTRKIYGCVLEFKQHRLKVSRSVVSLVT